MQLLRDDGSWVEATYAASVASAKPMLAVSVVGEGGFVVRFADAEEAKAFARAVERSMEPVLWCQNCDYTTPKGRKSVNAHGWGPRCPRCKEDHLQLKRKDTP